MKTSSSQFQLLRLICIGLLLTVIILFIAKPNLLRAPKEVVEIETYPGSRFGETGLPAPDGKSSLTGGTWELYRIGDESVSESRRPELTFSLTEDGRLSGKLCNTFSGSYTAVTEDGLRGVLTSKDIVSTKMFCQDPSMKAEEVLFEGLNKGVEYHITTGSMIVTTQSGLKLEFTKRIEWY